MRPLPPDRDDGANAREPRDSTLPATVARRSWAVAVLDHAPEYLIEAWALCTFMLSAGFIGTLLEYPASPVHTALPHPLLRRALMGLAMGLTALALIDSPWGRRSGAHMNPATTLVFLRLGKIRRRDAFFYMLAQFVGGAIGVAIVLLVLGSAFKNAPVLCVATLPGPRGPWVAFVAEVILTLVLMASVLWVSNSGRLHRYTGLFVACLLLIYITLEAPLSGMSLNPARSAASALWARAWVSPWVYLVAPPLGMLLAAQLYLWRRGQQHVYCAKLRHSTTGRCIFRCRIGQLFQQEP